MADTEFLRSDELPGRAALGYLATDGVSRTNVFHLPVRGSGDGGIYSTVADIAVVLDRALRRPDRAGGPGRRAGAAAQRAATDSASGFPSENAVALEGSDAGVSFRSVHNPVRRITHTVISNESDGAWPIARLLEERLGQ